LWTTIVTASEDKTARLWATESGGLLATLQGHDGFVTSAQFSPDGKRVVTPSRDKTARLWETHPVQASDLRDPKTGEIKWPGTSLESGQHDSDQLSVIDVP
jgi:WD40 repeat protein